VPEGRAPSLVQTDLMGLARLGPRLVHRCGRSVQPRLSTGLGTPLASSLAAPAPGARAPRPMQRPPPTCACSRARARTRRPARRPPLTRRHARAGLLLPQGGARPARGGLGAQRGAAPGARGRPPRQRRQPGRRRRAARRRPADLAAAAGGPRAVAAAAGCGRRERWGAPDTASPAASLPMAGDSLSTLLL